MRTAYLDRGEGRLCIYDGRERYEADKEEGAYPDDVVYGPGCKPGGCNWLDARGVEWLENYADEHDIEIGCVVG